MRIRWLILILIIIPLKGFNQVVTKQQILQNVVNRWWMLTFDSKTWNTSDKETIKKNGPAGFALKKDGTYEMFVRTHCGWDTPPLPNGKWRVSNDTIYFENARDTRVMKVISADGTTLRTN